MPVMEPGTKTVTKYKAVIEHLTKEETYILEFSEVSECWMRQMIEDLMFADNVAIVEGFVWIDAMERWKKL